MDVVEFLGGMTADNVFKQRGVLRGVARLMELRREWPAPAGQVLEAWAVSSCSCSWDVFLPNLASAQLVIALQRVNGIDVAAQFRRRVLADPQDRSGRERSRGAVEILDEGVLS